MSSPTSIPRSGLFQAPGRPLAPARTEQVRRLLADEMSAAVADQGLRVVNRGNTAVLILHGQDLGLTQICEFAEAALKRAVRRLTADLIGGANVTRLDGVLASRHPRLPYRRALRIVAGRGWRLSLGDELTPEAQASLVRFCNHLPVQVMLLAGQPQPGQGDPHRSGLSYVVPWGGEALRAEVPAGDQTGPVVCRLHLDRLLQFVLGLDSDAVGG
ncbi:MAG: hypothetical protein R3D98_00725 [Candidatus Krumholzibacteriia bacterium]